MLFKKGNDPFAEVIQPPDSIGHSISVVSPYYSAAEDFLQRVQQLNITSMLNNREFGEYLKLARHLWVRIDADAETSFSIDKSDHPLSF